MHNAAYVTVGGMTIMIIVSPIGIGLIPLPVYYTCVCMCIYIVVFGDYARRLCQHISRMQTLVCPVFVDT